MSLLAPAAQITTVFLLPSFCRELSCTSSVVWKERSEGDRLEEGDQTSVFTRLWGQGRGFSACSQQFLLGTWCWPFPICLVMGSVWKPAGSVRMGHHCYQHPGL